MKKKALFALTVFVVMISSMGFICSDEEDDVAYGRVDHWGDCTLSEVSYGSTKWYNLTYDNTPSDFKEIPLSSEYIVIISGNYTYQSSSKQAAPEKDHYYTLRLDDYGTCYTANTVFYFDVIDHGTTRPADQ